MAFALQSRSVSAARTSVQAPKPSIRTVMPMRAQRLIARADKAAVLADVQSIIAEQLGKPIDEVKAEAKFVDLGADSLDTVEIMMALEEKFELTLDEEGAEKISTVQEAADLIATQIASK